MASCCVSVEPPSRLPVVTFFQTAPAMRTGSMPWWSKKRTSSTARMAFWTLGGISANLSGTRFSNAKVPMTVSSSSA